MIKKEIDNIIKEKKQQCQYSENSSCCDNCRKFVNIAGHGYSFQFCDDERNDIIPNQHRLPVSFMGCCNYWEKSMGAVEDALSHRNISDHF